MKEPKQKKDYLKSLHHIMQSAHFETRILGQWYEPREYDGKENKPSKAMWDILSKVCYKIEQPCARERLRAEPGDWYLSLCGKRDWYIFEKTEEGSRRPFNIPGLVAGEMIEALMYVDAFIFQYNSNRTGEDKS